MEEKNIALPDKNIWHVYILTCADGTFYCGITKDITRRMRAHNGLCVGGAKYTRGRRPITLSAFIKVDGHKEAEALERHLKTLKKHEKIPYLKALENILPCTEHLMNTFELTSPAIKKDQLCNLVFKHESLFQKDTLFYSDPFMSLKLRIGDILYLGDVPCFQVKNKLALPDSLLPVFHLKCLSNCKKTTQNFTHKKNAFTLAVITLSDKGFVGKRIDESGPAVQKLIAQHLNLAENSLFILPDNKTALRDLISNLTRTQGYDLIVCNGGTGLSETDITADALLPLLDSRVPGFEIAMMQKSLEKTPTAMISRAFCGIIDKSLLIAVPGSLKGAVENIEAVLPALSHALAKLGGDTADCALL